MKQKIVAWKKKKGNEALFAVHLPVGKLEIPAYILGLDQRPSLVEIGVGANGNMSTSRQAEVAFAQTMLQADRIVRLLHIIDTERSN